MIPDFIDFHRTTSNGRNQKAPVSRGLLVFLGLPWILTWWRRGHYLYVRKLMILKDNSISEVLTCPQKYHKNSSFRIFRAFRLFFGSRTHVRHIRLKPPSSSETAPAVARSVASLSQVLSRVRHKFSPGHRASGDRRVDWSRPRRQATLFPSFPSSPVANSDGPCPDRASRNPEWSVCRAL